MDIKSNPRYTNFWLDLIRKEQEEKEKSEEQKRIEAIRALINSICQP